MELKKTFFSPSKAQKQKLLLFLMTATAIVGLWKELSAHKKQLGMGMEPISILISRAPIHAGDALTQESFDVHLVPKAYVPLGALRESDMPKVMGQTLLHTMDGGEMFLWSKLDLGTQGNTPSAKIVPGYRAITVPVDAQSSHGGALAAGDHIDLSATISHPQTHVSTTLPLLQNVSILHVGNPASANESFSTVTLMVLPSEIPLIQHATQQGQIHLSLRHPEDFQTPGIERVRGLQDLIAKALDADTQATRNQAIEIIRGGSHVP